MAKFPFMNRALLLTLLATCLTVATRAQDAALGKWWSPDRDGQIEIYKSGNKYFGRLIWSKNPRKDTENPDKALRSRDLVGMNLFTNFNYDADDKEWVDGKIYDPKNGKTYSCKMWLTDNGKTLNARGYVGISLLGRTAKFTRVE